MSISVLGRGAASRHAQRAALRRVTTTATLASSSTSEAADLADFAGLTSPLAKYEALCASGTLTRDRHQVAALEQLDALWNTLAKRPQYAPPPPKRRDQQAGAGSGGGGVGAALGNLARRWGVAMGGGSENPSGAGGVKVSKFGAPQLNTSSSSSSSSSSGGVFFGGLFGGGPTAAAAAPLARPPANAPRGLYLHGGVGTGKTCVLFKADKEGA
jgi:predicted ATPase